MAPSSPSFPLCSWHCEGTLLLHMSCMAIEYFTMWMNECECMWMKCWKVGYSPPVAPPLSIAFLTFSWSSQRRSENPPISAVDWAAALCQKQEKWCQWGTFPSNMGDCREQRTNRRYLLCCLFTENIGWPAVKWTNESVLTAAHKKEHYFLHFFRENSCIFIDPFTFIQIKKISGDIFVELKSCLFLMYKDWYTNILSHKKQL